MARGILLAGAALAMSLGAIGCDLAPPDVFDPRLIQQDERNHASEVTAEDLRPLPTTREGAFAEVGPNGSPDNAQGRPYRPTTGPDLDKDPIVRMSLQEVIHRAVANNHDVKVAGYQPAIEATRVIEAAANFDPAFFTNLQYQQKRDLNGGEIYNSFTGGPTFISTIADQDIGTFQTGFQQNLNSGGQIQLQYQTTYNWFSPQQTFFNPFYESDLTLSLTQPLLKNFGYDVNQAQIVINRLNQRVSLLEFRKSVEQDASDIEKLYWQLAQAERDIDVEQDLVVKAEGTYKILYTRWKQGLDVSPLQVAQAQTELEAFRSQLIQFKSQARDDSDQIKGLMSDPEYPVASSVVILPADQPVEEPLKFDLEDQINTAMENRLELGEDQLKVNAATVTIGVAKNNLLPEFDFVGSVGPEGAAGNIGDALRSNANFDHIDFSAGFKLTIPLGNRAARSVWQRSLWQRMAQIETYRSDVEKISVDVKLSARAVDTAWDVICSSRRQRFAAEDALRNINAREKANEPLTPEFVTTKLDVLDRLSAALQGEALAVANYNVALAQLERSKGTLLRYNNVVLQEAPTTLQDAGIAH